MSAAENNSGEHGVWLEWPEPRLTPLQRLKLTLLEIAGEDTREAIKLVERVFEAVPELRDV